MFGGLGVALLAGGAAVPAYETLLFVWGGTALFVALLLGVVMTGPTVSSAVATDIHATMAANARRSGPGPNHEYVPVSDGVTLVAGDSEFDAVGERLLRSHDDLASTETAANQLSVLVDALVNDLELADRATATTDGESATVRAVGSRVGTAELFDHPVASVVGVGLAHGLGTTVAVEATREGETLVVDATLTSTE